MYSASQLSDVENGRDWNHRHHDPHLLGNGYSVVENAGASGVNNMVCFDIPMRLNGLQSGIHGTDIPDYMADNSRYSHDPYLHHSSAGNPRQVPSNYVQHVQPFNNHYAPEATSSTNFPQTEYGRVSYKRKSPTFSATYERGSSSGYYSAGTSSSVNVSSNPLQSNAIPTNQFWPLTSVGHDYRIDNFSATGGLQRNVRSRQSSSTLNLEPSPSGLQSMSNPRRLILPANVSRPNVTVERIHNPTSMDPHRSIIFSDIGSYVHGTNQTLVGGGISRGMGIHGDNHYSHVLRRSPSPPLPAFYVPFTEDMDRRIHYHQRTYYTGPGQHPIEFAAEDGRRPSLETMVSSRLLRPLAVSGHSDDMIGRGRNLYRRLPPSSDEDSAANRWSPQGMAMMEQSALFDSRRSFDHYLGTRLNVDNMRSLSSRPQPYSDDDYAPNRWAPQGVAMIERSTLFDSRSAFDDHLDIDNLSYEELLALEEMIGDVNTGLSEGAIGKSLKEISYCSDLNQEEEDRCIICLEEYKNGDDLARLNCGHDYHFICIKKWLLIKNVCPICKADVAEQ